MAQHEATYLKRAVVFTILVLFGLFLMLMGVGAETSRGYAVEPCTTMAVDLANAGASADDFDMHMNLIGCEMDGGGVWTLSQYNPLTGEYQPCGVYAYLYAAHYIHDGGDVLRLEPTKGFRTYMAQLGCPTFYEDGSWG